MTWVTGAMLAFGAVCLVHGFRIRAGRSRSFFPRYRTSFLGRNAPFALIPAGIWLIAAAGALIASDADVGAAVGLLTPIAFVALLVALVWLLKPPKFMKPHWLREVESGALPEPAGVYGAPSPTGARRIYLPPVAYWSLWVLTGAVFALMAAFAWSWGVLIGLGAAISLLAAHTPNKA